MIKKILQDAIENGFRVAFIYHKTIREGIPKAVLIGPKGPYVVLAFGCDFKNFTLKKIQSNVLSNFE